MVERRRSSYCLFCLLRVEALYIDRSREKPQLPGNSNSRFCCTVIRVSHLLRSVANKSYMCFCNIAIFMILTRYTRHLIIINISLSIFFCAKEFKRKRRFLHTRIPAPIFKNSTCSTLSNVSIAVALYCITYICFSSIVI